MKRAECGNTDTSTVAWEPWIQTATGVVFHYLSGDESEIISEDIATALSRQPRWAGHTNRFYSVAQHCVETASLVAEMGGDVAEQLHALLHDATEAYMCDIPSPLKRLIPDFRKIEAEVWGKISRRYFGSVRSMTARIHEADLTMLVTEARDLFNYPPAEDWVKRCDQKPLKKILVPIAERDARDQYLDDLLQLIQLWVSSPLKIPASVANLQAEWSAISSQARSTTRRFSMARCWTA